MKLMFTYIKRLFYTKIKLSSITEREVLYIKITSFQSAIPVFVIDKGCDQYNYREVYHLQIQSSTPYTS